MPLDIAYKNDLHLEKKLMILVNCISYFISTVHLLPYMNLQYQQHLFSVNISNSEIALETECPAYGIFIYQGQYILEYQSINLHSYNGLSSICSLKDLAKVKRFGCGTQQNNYPSKVNSTALIVDLLVLKICCCCS